jgi:CDP-diacylglycerol--glycerol-3-phosphate 3-phosphatidyltransferase
VKPAPLDPAGYPVSDTPIVNLPNALTVLRLLCVPVLAFLLFADHGGSESARKFAALVFVAASITDFMDGAIARKRGQVTNFGKIVDPIADKALIGTALIGLSLLGDLAWWVTIVILARELAVTLLRFWVIEHGVIPASRGGKAKTVMQTIAITMYLIDLPNVPWWGAARAIVMAVAVILTLGTGMDYVVRARRLRRVAPGETTLDGAVR